MSKNGLLYCKYKIFKNNEKSLENMRNIVYNKENIVCDIVQRIGGKTHRGEIMRVLCESIKQQTIINFINFETAVKTYDRNALVCGSPAWRYVYHTIHSADKWFINPFIYSEPEFHIDGMDNPDNRCDLVLSDTQLLEYLDRVKCKTLDYIDSLDDNALRENPEGCRYTRIELILGQFRHINHHIGMLNGQTVERTGRFPLFCGLTGTKRLKNGLYDE